MNLSATVERCNGCTLQYIQCCTSSVATASVDCRVCRFGSDRTWQITSSVVGNFLGGNIFVQANAWISCKTIVLVLFPLVNMLIKEAMSTSRFHIKFKNRQNNIEIHGNSNIITCLIFTNCQMHFLIFFFLRCNSNNPSFIRSCPYQWGWPDEPHFREDCLRQKFLHPDALPNSNLYHRSGKWPISCLLWQDGRPTILNLTEHSCMQ